MSGLGTGRPAAGLGALFLVLYPMLSDDEYHQNMIILSLVLAVGASGLNIITGLAGYVSLGQGAFVGLGGYTVAVLATRVHGPPVWLWIPVAGLLAAAVAVVLGLAALRSRGPSFVIITVAFLFLVQVTAVNWTSLTNGTAGLTLPLPTWDARYKNWPFYYALVVLLALQLLLSRWIQRTRFGRGLVAIREDEDKAAGLGIDLPAEKILAFAASAVFVGMAGGVYGYYLTFIDPRGMFGILLSVQIVLALLLGGKGTLYGPVLGAFVLEPLNEYANDDLGGGNARLLIFGGLLVLLVLFLPKGILPGVEDFLLAHRAKGKAGLPGARIGESRGHPATRPYSSSSAASRSAVLLELYGLEKRFGGLRAVDGCTLQVPEGSITGLIGPNGSGKTTVFDLIDGALRPDAGRIRFAGERIDRLPPWTRAHRGLGRTFQTTRLFREMTVLENVVAPQRRLSWRRLGRIAVSGAEAARATELLEFVGMHEFRDHRATALSYGQQKLVELAQILMLDPRLILLDEPTAGIDPVLVERMAEMIRELNAGGRTFLIVEHNMPFVLGLCDPVHVLAAGRRISTGTPREVRQDPAVIDAYLGDGFGDDTPPPARPPPAQTGAQGC